MESTEDGFVAEYSIAPRVGMVKYIFEREREAAELQAYKLVQAK